VPKAQHRVRIVRVVRAQPAWRDLPQDRAREWLKGQIEAFCGRYPKDESCVAMQRERQP
jgi:hypothetical protein